MKIAIITGSSGQLGKEMVRKYNKEGWKIIGIDLQTSDLEVDHFIGGSVSTREPFIEAFNYLNATKENIERVTLINNAGVAVFTPSEARTDKEIHHVSSINLNSTIYGTTELAKYAKTITENDSHTIRYRVVNIASVYGLISPNNSIYTDTARNSSEIYGATKAGIIQMTKYFAARYSHIPISVNCIAPGGIENKEIQGDQFISNYNGLVPQKRMCLAKEVGDLCFFLGSNDIDYLSGQTIALDGGMTSW